MNTHRNVAVSAMRMRNVIISSLFLSIASPVMAADYPALPEYRVDLKQTSVSGVSSGAYFAAQFHVAWSSKFVGAGVFSGGPWACNLDFLTVPFNTECMNKNLTDDRIDQIVERANYKAGLGTIDPIDELVNDHIYISLGTGDQTVTASVTRKVKDFYEKVGMPTENIILHEQESMGHAIPTLDYGNDCDVTTEPPWISNCGFDGAGEMLKHIYGEENLVDRVPKEQLSGEYIFFDQSEFTLEAVNKTPAQIGMDDMGILYVPEACNPTLHPENECKLHVFFHGCEQGYNTRPVDRDSPSTFGYIDPEPGSNPGATESWPGGPWPGVWPRYSWNLLDPIGDTLVKGVGLNEWADANKMIVMYPQWIKTSFPVNNPKGCNDWWGYAGSNYDEKDAPQMKSIQLMIERMLGGEFINYEQKKALKEAGEIATEAQAYVVIAQDALADAQAAQSSAESTNNIATKESQTSVAEDAVIDAQAQSAPIQAYKDEVAALRASIENLPNEDESDTTDYVGGIDDIISQIDGYLQTVEDSVNGAEAAVTAIETNISDAVSAATTSAQSIHDEIKDAHTEAGAAKTTAENQAQLAKNATDSMIADVAAQAAVQAAQEAAQHAGNANALLTTINPIMTKADGSSAESAVQAIYDSAQALAAQAKAASDAAEIAKQEALQAFSDLLGDEARQYLEESQAALTTAQNAQLAAAAAAVQVRAAEQLAVEAITIEEAVAAAQQAADNADIIQASLVSAQGALSEAERVADIAQGSAVETNTQNTVTAINALITQIETNQIADNNAFSNALDAVYSMALAKAQEAAALAADAKARALAAKAEAQSSPSAEDAILAAEEADEIADEFPAFIEMAEEALGNAQQIAEIQNTAQAASNATDSTTQIQLIIDQINADLATAETSFADAKQAAIDTAESEYEAIQQEIADAKEHAKNQTEVEDIAAAEERIEELEQALEEALTVVDEALVIGGETAPTTITPPVSEENSGGGGGSTGLWLLMLSILAAGIRRKS